MPTRLSPTDFRAVLFDVDGTLLNSLGVIVPVLQETVNRFCGYVPTEPKVRSLIGVPLDQQFALYSENRLSEAETRQAVAFAIEGIEAGAHQETWFGPALESLAFLANHGLQVALVTSKTKAELIPFLDRFPARAHLSATVCASDVRSPKPDPESAFLACRHLGVTPDQAFFVGDSVFDLRCAHQAGMASVGVAYGAAPREILAAENPSQLFDHPEELLDWVQSAFLNLSCPERS